MGAVGPYVLSYKGEFWHEGADLGHPKPNLVKNRLKVVTLKNVVLQPPKSPKLVIIWYKFAHNPLKRFLQNKARGRMSQVRTITPNFTVVTLKAGAADRGRHWAQR